MKFADDPLTLLFLQVMLTYVQRFYPTGESILEKALAYIDQFSGHVETSRLVCSANQCTDFYVIGKWLLMAQL